MKILIFLIVLFSSLAIASGMIILSYLFGPKSKNKIKSENFECGMPQADKPKKSIHTNFYLIAVLFIVMDIEILYLYPWSVSFRNLDFIGVFSGFLFISILLLAIFYVIKRGALKWD